MSNIINLPTYEQVNNIGQQIQGLEYDVGLLETESITDYTHFISDEPTITSHYAYTVIEIDGSGVLMKLENTHTSQTYKIRLQCDDGAIREMQIDPKGNQETFFPFKSNLRITIGISTAANNIRTHYLLK